MANPKHLKILKKGVEAWDAWRKKQRNEPIRLPLRPPIGAESDAKLSDADFTGAKLNGAKLSSADLSFAHLSGADLTGADLSGADLSFAHLSGAKLSDADFSDGDLKGAGLSGVDLCGANLGHADLSGANLTNANLINANLTNANLINANLTYANLTYANLSDSNFIGANLTGAHIDGKLNKTDLSFAKIGNTTFSNVDLREVAGLYDVFHSSPSTIGIDTLYKSKGEIPDKFLRDAGVPEEIIDIARSIRVGPPIQWHSCFISYSTKDDEFARRLHARMREANMRVWFAPENLKGGRKLPEQIFEAIQLQDKLLLVLSDASILSDWVMSEVRAALANEKKESRRKLYPIRLVDFQTLKEWKCFDSDAGKDLAVEVRAYFIPDFSNWKDHDAFEAAFARLQKDLKAETKPRSIAERDA